jgi:hypothetical protein
MKVLKLGGVSYEKTEPSLGGNGNLASLQNEDAALLPSQERKPHPV